MVDRQLTLYKLNILSDVLKSKQNSMDKDTYCQVMGDVSACVYAIKTDNQWDKYRWSIIMYRMNGYYKDFK